MNVTQALHEANASGVPVNVAVSLSQTTTGPQPMPSCVAPSARCRPATTPPSARSRRYSFDQRGVELGKVPAVAIIPALESATDPELGHDSSTNALIRHYRTLKD
ncbi:hypothetical protein ABZ471_25280 [Streptomyces sp. NPDC005728]|uniref:hypothetical protein n=1 Tax=Streptomyces sp. NPDC005728 TaxID=3157054 RepID=UPI0033E22ACA